ncbi:hypothetical protein AB0J21_33450 [Streptomyces sp. NPDC049954]|uniref:hypothetical protein n=1 Tax=Streptomyces sp. NPDC049954 TaxID=3155779 RepID=UPI003422ECCA
MYDRVGTVFLIPRHGFTRAPHRVIVLDGGHLTEDGAPDTLTEHNGDPTLPWDDLRHTYSDRQHPDANAPARQRS